MNSLTIGSVAKIAGVGIETVRFYERKGLIPDPPRKESGYRQYPEKTVARLRFIKRAKELGFSLKEIKELLSLRASPKAKCEDVRTKAESKKVEIDRKIAALQGMNNALSKLIKQCKGSTPVTACPILEDLSGEDVG